MTHAFAFCDLCQIAPAFTSVEARDKWESTHKCGDDTESADPADFPMAW